MTAGSPVASSEREVSSLWVRPPGRQFHLMLVAPALMFLWSLSVPGSHFFLLLLSVLLLGIGVLVWTWRLMAYGLSRWRLRRTAHPGWFLVAPLCGALLAGLTVANVPLKARWALSRPAFDGAVEEIIAEDVHRMTGSERLGLYSISRFDRHGDAIFFYEQSGGFLGISGFAYLPDGPRPQFDRYFETLSLTHLQGPWYIWSSSI
jgi:hypothetical protein